jgi:ribonucleoside-diphosphate reductase subunit M1
VSIGFLYLNRKLNIFPYNFNRLAAQTSAGLATQHPDYSILAARISISHLHKMPESKFSKLCEIMYEYIEEKTGEPAPFMSKEDYDIAITGKLDDIVDHTRD